jgi:uroporphyrinogen decarboxylase
VNGYERIAAALRGERPDGTPVMLHNFMMAAREAGMSMREFRADPTHMARAFIQAVERYGYDGIVLDVDTATLAGAAGVLVDFPEDEPARTRGGMLGSLAEAATLEDPAGILAYPSVEVWLEAARLLARTLGNTVFLRGNCDQSPFTLAGLLRGMDNWLLDCLDPDHEVLAHALLEHCTNITCTFLRAMAATGVHMLSNGDSAAGPDLASPALYRRFALPYERRVASCAHEEGLPYVLHICGNTGPILTDMIATGADGLELDYKTDARRAHALMKDRTVFIGNIDPSGVLALGTPALVTERTRELLATFADTPRFILNAGCAIPPSTPPENLRAMITAAREMRA